MYIFNKRKRKKLNNNYSCNKILGLCTSIKIYIKIFHAITYNLTDNSTYTVKCVHFIRLTNGAENSSFKMQHSAVG